MVHRILWGNAFSNMIGNFKLRENMFYCLLERLWLHYHDYLKVAILNIYVKFSGFFDDL